MGACENLCEEVALPKAVDLLVDAFRDLLCRGGLKPEVATVLAREHADQILMRLGGGWVYLPKGINYTQDARQVRNETIRAMARSGVKPRAVCQVFRLSRSQFYKIIGKRKDPQG